MALQKSLMSPGKDASISSFGTKKGAGSSGVPLRCHTKAEHDLLDRNQKSELRDWRKGKRSKEGKDKRKDAPSKKGKLDNMKAVASAVEKKVAEKMKAMEQAKTNEGETEACIMSIVQKLSAGKSGKGEVSGVSVGSAAIAPAPTPALKSILSRAQNAKPRPRTPALHVSSTNSATRRGCQNDATQSDVKT